MKEEPAGQSEAGSAGLILMRHDFFRKDRHIVTLPSSQQVIKKLWDSSKGKSTSIEGSAEAGRVQAYRRNLIIRLGLID